MTDQLCNAIPGISKDQDTGVPIHCILKPGHEDQPHKDVRSDGEEIFWFDPIPGPWSEDL